MKHDWQDKKSDGPLPMVICGIATIYVCGNCGMVRVHTCKGKNVYVHPDGETVTVRYWMDGDAPECPEVTSE